MKRQTVYLALVFIMIVWGLNVTWLKLLTQYGSPLIVQSIRILTASIILIVILKLMRIPLMPKQMPWKLIMIGCFFGVICHQGFLIVGIQETTAMKTAIISGASPIMTALVAVLFKDTEFTWFKFFGFTLGAMGVFFAVVEDFSELLVIHRGDVFVFIAFIVQAFGFLAVRKGTRSISPLLMTTWMLSIGSVVLLTLALVIEPTGLQVFEQFSLNSIILFFVSAILATAISQTLYNVCIKYIGTAESALFTNLCTVFSIIGAYFILSDAITAQQIYASVVILVGVFIGSLKTSKPVKGTA